MQSCRLIQYLSKGIERLITEDLMANRKVGRKLIKDHIFCNYGANSISMTLNLVWSIWSHSRWWHSVLWAMRSPVWPCSNPHVPDRPSVPPDYLPFIHQWLSDCFSLLSVLHLSVEILRDRISFVLTVSSLTYFTAQCLGSSRSHRGNMGLLL